MPFKFRWPFSWPRRERKSAHTPAPDAGSVSDASAPPSAASALAPAHDALPSSVQLSRAESPSPPRDLAPAAQPDTPTEPDGPDLGLELLSRLPALATPPILGRLGGLPAMAQTLPTVERFFKNLPVPPPPPTLPGLGEAAEFAANLPALVGFTEPDAGGRAPAFPAQLEPPSEPTDVLAPPGGMPGQIAGLSGAAAVLEPSRPPAIQPIIVPSIVSPPATAPVGPPPAAPLQRAVDSASLPAQVRAAAPQGPIAALPVLPLGAQAPAAWTQPPAAITQVLSPAQTLTGNILPGETLVPIQREVLRASGDEWQPPSAFVQPMEPTGERVSPEQRDSIESQRGQGRPLEPETRQRFEQAYGQPLDDVRVHTGPAAESTAQSLNAIAFASGQDLFFTQNTYEPNSPQGLSLIGHELAHVIQQQYGVPGDADELRPPDDRYERQADQLAARALDTSVFPNAPAAQSKATSAAVQRAQDDELRGPGSPPRLPTASTWSPGESLQVAANFDGSAAQPLASALPLTAKLPEEEPIQRFAESAGARPSIAINYGPASIALATNAPVGALPSLDYTPQRAGQVTEQLLSPAAMLTRPPSLSQNLPGLGRVIDAGQGLPVFRSISRGLPGLGSLPDLTRGLPDLGSANLPDTSALTDQLPSMPGMPSLPSLGDSAPAMPDLGGVAQGLSGGLPHMPGLPSSLASGLPTLGGLTPPAMPLAEGLGAASQAASEAANGALAAGQPALGTITGMGPAAGDTPAAPALPSLEKLTEHVWKEVQRKLKVERERSRGLA